MSESQLNGSIDVAAKYEHERNKRLRLRPEGVGQYIDLETSEKYKHFIEDPWIDEGTKINEPVVDGSHVKALIIGGGFGGILLAVKLIQQGVSVDDIMIVDPAGGFGGTWYWNRYPGLMCDVESYIYLPLLEEMNYMPKDRYAFGPEIRQYIEKICSKYGLHSRAMFQSNAKSAEWDQKAKKWVVNIGKKPKGGQESIHTVNADYFLIASGVLNHPKVPNLPGIDSFQGHMFHTSRWDYAFTGGQPGDPQMAGLRGKKVGLIGTGATAIQAVPELAKYAEKLVVFQRTPSAVDIRGNHKTDPEWWKTNVATKEGWHKERNLNFASFIHDDDPKPEKNLVDDGWTHMQYSTMVGTNKEVPLQKIGERIAEINAEDFPRQDRIRQRALDIVKDAETARRLQPWYQGWCKRPCFHDEYLQAFNLPHVTLVDTEGEGLDRVFEDGVEVAGNKYELDVIIWGTGYRSPLLGSPAGKVGMSVKGKDGLDMDETHSRMELKTLHGVTARGFPNLFWPGQSGGGATANYAFVLDMLSTHIAYLITEAERKTSKDSKPVIQPTSEAQEAWAQTIAAGAHKFAGMAGCTPGYLNLEGGIDQMTPEQRAKSAQLSLYAHGFPSFISLLEEWRAKGDLGGLEITASA